MDIITQKDFSIRYYEIFTVSNNYLINFSHFFGISLEFYAGFYGFAFITPGLSIIGAILLKLGISSEIFLRVLIIFLIFGFFLLPLIINKKSKIPILFNLITLIFLTNSTGWIEFLRNGIPHDLTGALLSVISSIFLEELISFLTKNNTQIKSRAFYFRFIINLLFLVLVSLIHIVYIVIPCITVIVSIIIQYNSVRSQIENDSKQSLVVSKIWIKKIMITFGLLISFTILLCFFWVLAFIENLDVLFGSTNYLGGYDEDKDFWGQFFILLYFQNFPPLLLPFLIIGVYTSCRQKTNKFLQIYSYTFLTILIILTLFALILPSLLIIIGRLTLFFDFIVPAELFFGFHFIYSKIKVWKIKISLKNLTISYILLVCLISGFSRITYNEDFTEENPEIQSLFSWIQNNTTEESRILLEDTTFLHYPAWGNGRINTLAPIYTDRQFIGGFLHTYFNNHTDYANFFAGRVFNQSILSFDILEFNNELKKFNIEYLIVWHPDSLLFLRNHSEYFLELNSIGDFTIFHYNDAIQSFCMNESLETIENIHLVNEQGKQSFLISNVTKDDEITISIIDRHQWHVYINSTQVEKGSNGYFITFNANLTGNIEVVLLWEEDPIIVYSTWIDIMGISLLGISVLVFSLIFILKRKQL